MSEVRNNKGFSLMELMIVVAIIGIIAAIAYPSYLNNVRETRRATAQAELMEIAQWMERQYSANFSYLNGGNPPALPFTQSPQSGTAFYNLSLVNGSTTQAAYVLQAVPTGDQANDACGTLTVNQAGARTPANCW
ncbi:type IV pilin protein [Marinobacter sp. V034]|uniref:type IV pilin protein n=1 Tax=Marinobacter sp. V034 TaxID=3459610 RepID=UPI004044B7B4